MEINPAIGGQVRAAMEAYRDEIAAQEERLVAALVANGTLMEQREALALADAVEVLGNERDHAAREGGKSNATQREAALVLRKANSDAYQRVLAQYVGAQGAYDGAKLAAEVGRERVRFLRTQAEYLAGTGRER